MEEQSPPPVSRWREQLRSLRLALKRAAPFATGVIATLLALLIYNNLAPAPHQITQREVSDTVAAAMASATPPPAYSASVYQIIRPSLVLIQRESPAADGKTEHALGSGVIIDDRGDILTSLHVVDNATAIQLTFADGSQSSGKIINKQPETDIAVLQAEKPPSVIVPAVLGNPRAMNIGDEAYAVGNPFGLYGSMSSGIISGFDRAFRAPNSGQTLQGLIQVDTAVNPGNSGGPLLNREGQVIGIVVGILNPTEQDFFIGIGFAVPINVAGGAAGSPAY